ncbi:hypothetical protein, partial [Pontibacterium sp.]|uniref:hypothetical protein n=1 Tax=Pontibacterium sp. TaxID=2036026 RepID=UPI00356A7BDA
ISKGLTITIQNVALSLSNTIAFKVPKLRANTLVPPTFEEITEGNVKVYIESGIHEEYTFPSEDNYSLVKNRKLTEEFGLYFVCNDRIIVASSTEKIHGWTAKWHAEYNGFVCWIRFTSEDAGLLPWNTAKTALKTDSTIFLKIRDQLAPIANKYRSDIKARYTKKKGTANTRSNTSKSKAKATQRVDALDNKTNETALVEPSQDNSSNKNFHSVDSNRVFRAETKVPESTEILTRLNQLDSKKLGNLYKSLCSISLVSHSALMYVGAWSFFESLSTLIGKPATEDMPAFLNKKTNEWFSDRSEKGTYKTAISHVNQEGNSTKHHGVHYRTDAKQLANTFETLEPLILKALDLAIEKKQASKAS